MKNCVVANSEIGSDGRLIFDFNLLFFLVFTTIIYHSQTSHFKTLIFSSTTQRTFHYRFNIRQQLNQYFIVDLTFITTQ
jgi:hypothetical protein